MPKSKMKKDFSDMDYSYYSAAQPYLKSKEWDQAIPEFQKGIDYAILKKNRQLQAFYLSMQALMYILMKQPEKALANYKEAVQVDSRHMDSHFHLGNFFFKEMKDFPKAKEELRLAIQLPPRRSPMHHTAYNTLGLVYIAENNLGKAAEMMKKSFSEYSGIYGYDLILMKQLFSLEKTKPVLECISRVVKKYPNIREYRYFYSVVLLKSGKKKEAIANWKRYLKIPNLPKQDVDTVRKYLDKLEKTE